MKSIHIREIHPDTLNALKRLAAMHHRSLQGELVAILEQAAQFAPPAEPEPLLLNLADSGNPHLITRRELYDDHR